MSRPLPTHRTVWWSLVAVVSYAAILTPLVPQQTARIVIVLAFLLWAPGAALVAAVPELDPGARWALAPGVSVAAVLLVSMLMLELGMWFPRVVLLVGAAGCCLVAVAALVRPSLRRLPKESPC